MIIIDHKKVPGMCVDSKPRTRKFRARKVFYS